jgi:hypothetical protein
MKGGKSEHFLLLLDELKKSSLGDLLFALFNILGMRIVLFVIVAEHFKQFLFISDTIVSNVLKCFLFHPFDHMEQQLFLLNHFQVFSFFDFDILAQ